jgi:hypothetical protein
VAGRRALLARVSRLERTRESPVFVHLASPEFEAEMRAGVEVGRYDAKDMEIILASVQKWARDRVWELWS